MTAAIPDPVTITTTIPVTIRQLSRPDIARWTTNARERSGLERQLGRVDAGRADYLVAALPSGVIAGKAGIDLEKIAGAGYLFQVDVIEPLRSCGIGTAMIRAAEARIGGRGLASTRIGVESDNVRARALYERLGFQAYDSEAWSWDQERDDGSTYLYTCTGVLLRKAIRGSEGRAPRADLR